MLSNSRFSRLPLLLVTARETLRRDFAAIYSSSALFHGAALALSGIFHYIFLKKSFLHFLIISYWMPPPPLRRRSRGLGGQPAAAAAAVIPGAAAGAEDGRVA